MVLPSLKLTFSHLKNGGLGFGILIPFWGWPIFRGELLVSGRVMFDVFISKDYMTMDDLNLFLFTTVPLNCCDVMK